MPFRSEASQTLPAPAATQPSESAGETAIIASMLPVCRLARTSLWSPQLGIHKLEKSAARPEHGSCTATDKPTVLLPASSRLTRFKLAMETQTPSSATA